MDYFPLAAGMFWEYESTTPERRRRVRVEVLSVEESGGTTRAAGRSRVGDGPWLEFSVVRDADSVRIEGVVELPLPPVVGASWNAGGDALRVESDRAEARTPAGRFKDCLRVTVLIAGGDAGVGERLYAPGVGLVREALSDEGEPSEKTLVTWGMERP
ncbi:MAG: hypothetical protein KGL53_08800 [Elusimicrobia bacterium]|nr:hypothetical protein [Elusimicrobiota bacterium]